MQLAQRKKDKMEGTDIHLEEKCKLNAVFFYQNICSGSHWKRLDETLPMNTTINCFFEK